MKVFCGVERGMNGAGGAAITSSVLLPSHSNGLEGGGGAPEACTVWWSSGPA